MTSYKDDIMRLKFRVEKPISDCQEVGDSAHAHPRPDDPRYGTICFRTTDAVSIELIIHELAHLQDTSPQGGHGRSWWKLFLKMLEGIMPLEVAEYRRLNMDGT